LTKTRLQNDSMSNDAVKTAELRGRIAGLKELLALTAPAIEADDSGPTY
jgi:hypothetical protein